VSLGGVAGRYQILVSSRDKSEREITLKLDEIATGYQQQLGYQLDQNYCSRCHSSESSPERVSNHDNLEVKPHEFTDGDTLNKMSDADLLAIISHGGPSLNRSPLMPPYGSTLSKAEIQALIAYIRVISDPPYKAAGVVYTQQ
jgi:mono/diheme cytochrome c family protein